MKNIFLLFLLFPSLLSPQSLNHELEFNSSTQDYVQMQNTSSVIANKTAFSMSCWVNPQSSTDHSGIIGFRNNLDADFYLLQLQNSNNIEARFRGLSGLNYDIVVPNLLDFNQWQHLAFTYDGSYIRLYKDGALIDSSVANGIIAQNTLPFQLGKLDWQTTGFFMNGKLDEIRLWDVALSQIEINNWMCIPIDLSHPNYNNLMGYWRVNEGVGTTTIDLSVNGNNGTLFGGTTWQISSSCVAGSVVCGDVNEDGSVDSTDVTDIISFITGGLLPAFNLWAADVNCDGTINVSDITILNSFMSGAVSLNCCSISPPSLTYVPDNNFEAYLEINGMGNGIPYDDSVFTSAIDTLTYLDLSGGAGTAIGIFDLLGIEDFTALIYLDCTGNQLTSLDLSQNTALTYLHCKLNNLTSLDVSQNTALTYLHCGYNNLTSLDVSNSTLENLYCQDNQLTSLDVTQNTALNVLSCSNNQLTSLNVNSADSLIEVSCSNNKLTMLDVTNSTSLLHLNCNNNLLTSLDVRNGNNTNMGANFYADGNPNLTCINVDNSAWSTSNWTVANGNIDPQHYFSDNCSGTTDIKEYITNKELLKIIDLLGGKTKQTNQPLFYIYDDGTVEKRIVIE